MSIHSSRIIPPGDIGALTAPGITPQEKEFQLLARMGYIAGALESYYQNGEGAPLLTDMESSIQELLTELGDPSLPDSALVASARDALSDVLANHKKLAPSVLSSIGDFLQQQSASVYGSGIQDQDTTLNFLYFLAWSIVSPSVSTSQKTWANQFFSQGTLGSGTSFADQAGVLVLRALNSVESDKAPVMVNLWNGLLFQGFDQNASQVTGFQKFQRILFSYLYSLPGSISVAPSTGVGAAVVLSQYAKRVGYYLNEMFPLLKPVSSQPSLLTEISAANVSASAPVEQVTAAPDEKEVEFQLFGKLGLLASLCQARAAGNNSEALKNEIEALAYQLGTALNNLYLSDPNLPNRALVDKLLSMVTNLYNTDDAQVFISQWFLQDSSGNSTFKTVFNFMQSETNTLFRGGKRPAGGADTTLGLTLFALSCVAATRNGQFPDQYAWATQFLGEGTPGSGFTCADRASDLVLAYFYKTWGQNSAAAAAFAGQVSNFTPFFQAFSDPAHGYPAWTPGGRDIDLLLTQFAERLDYYAEAFSGEDSLSYSELMV